MNVVALAGKLSSPAQEKVFESGARMVTFQLTVPGTGPDSRAESVPVVWFEPKLGALDLDTGESVVVVGRVRRRFYRAGAVTQSRTEVVADLVSRTGRPAGVRLALTTAIERMAEGMDTQEPTARSPRGRRAPGQARR